MTAMRMQFRTIAIIVFIGILLTGLGRVHWFLYVPVVVLAFAGITGICPGMIFWKKIGLK